MRTRRTSVLTLALALVALATASVATSARPVKADKHDRALIKQLLKSPVELPEEAGDAQVDALTTVAQACPAWQQAGSNAAAVAPLLIFPALFQMLDGMEPQFAAYGRRIGAMRPHAAAFKQWIAMKRTETTAMVRFLAGFDSARLDVCAYLEAGVAAGTDEDALDEAILKLFSHPDDVNALLGWAESLQAGEQRATAANKRFAAFLKASGYTKAQIAALTDG